MDPGGRRPARKAARAGLGAAAALPGSTGSAHRLTADRPSTRRVGSGSTVPPPKEGQQGALARAVAHQPGILPAARRRPRLLPSSENGGAGSAARPSNRSVTLACAGQALRQARSHGRRLGLRKPSLAVRSHTAVSRAETAKMPWGAPACVRLARRRCSAHLFVAGLPGGARHLAARASRLHAGRRRTAAPCAFSTRSTMRPREAGLQSIASSVSRPTQGLASASAGKQRTAGHRDRGPRCVQRGGGQRSESRHSDRPAASSAEHESPMCTPRRSPAGGS